MTAALPILTYHSIAAEETISPALLASHLDALKRANLPCLTPAELDRAPRGFLLTFDDGFADFWTHAFPLLQERGLKATVFVIPSRAGEGEPRPLGERAWPGRAADAHRESSQEPGAHPAFLCWSELRALEASGLVAVQSHSWSHRMGWVGDEIVGFNLGRAHWSLAAATGGDERLGLPLYARGSALSHRLYQDDPALRDHLAEWLERRGGPGYISIAGTKAVERELHAEVQRFRKETPLRGRWESESERLARTEEEMVRAREALEAELGGRRDELCLPWGEYDAVTLACARRVGIRRVYTLDRGPNPAGHIGFLANRFEPRQKGRLWLRSRLWIYRSTWRGRFYAEVVLGSGKARSSSSSTQASSPTISFRWFRIGGR